MDSAQWDFSHGKPERALQLRVFLRALKGCPVMISSRLEMHGLDLAFKK
jgi:hypothetical protein